MTSHVTSKIKVPFPFCVYILLYIQKLQVKKGRGTCVMSYVTQKMEILFFPVYVLLYIPKVKKRWGYFPFLREGEG